MTGEGEPGGPPFDYSHNGELLGGVGNPFPQCTLINRIPYREFNLDHTVEVTCRYTFLATDQR